VEACRQVWGPNLSALSGEEQAEGLSRQLDAAQEALASLAGELPGLKKAVREARQRLRGKKKKK
jgi:predicted phage tail protein